MLHSVFSTVGFRVDSVSILSKVSSDGIGGGCSGGRGGNSGTGGGISC